MHHIDNAGYPDEVIEQLEAYDPVHPKEGARTIEENMNTDHIKYSRLSLIYNAFRAAGADQLDEKEAEAIRKFGKKLGATDEQIRQVQALYDDDTKLRKKRAAVLVPKNLDTVLNEFKKVH